MKLLNLLCEAACAVLRRVISGRNHPQQVTYVNNTTTNYICGDAIQSLTLRDQLVKSDHSEQSANLHGAGDRSLPTEKE